MKGLKNLSFFMQPRVVLNHDKMTLFLDHHYIVMCIYDMPLMLLYTFFLAK